MPSEVFLSLIVSTSSAVFLTIIGACIKSKCTAVKCFGIDIQRNVEIEEHIEEHQMDLNLGRNKTETI